MGGGSGCGCVWAAIEALTLFGNFPDLYGEPTLNRPVRVLSRPSASTCIDLRFNLFQLVHLSASMSSGTSMKMEGIRRSGTIRGFAQYHARPQKA